MLLPYKVPGDAGVRLPLSCTQTTSRQHVSGVYSAWIMWALVGEESGSRSNWDRSGGARLEPAQLRSEAEGVRQGLPGRS